MNKFVKQRVFIYGSCISRDVFTFDDSSYFELVDYIARSPFSSALSHPASLSVDIEKNDSQFQRRMLLCDLEKKLLDNVKMADFDILLIDLIDERINLIETKNKGLVAYSNELQRTGYKFSESDGRIISGFSDEAYLLWERAWENFVIELREIGSLEKLRVIQVYWSRDENGDVPDGFTNEAIRIANEWLERCYQRIAKDIPADQLVIIPDECSFSDANHIWGKAPFHYMKNYYLYVLSFLKKTFNLSHWDSNKSIGVDSIVKLTSHGKYFSFFTDSDEFAIKINIDESKLNGDAKLLVGFGKVRGGGEFFNKNELVKSHVEKFGFYKYFTRNSDGVFEAAFKCEKNIFVDFSVFIYNQDELELNSIAFSGLIESDKNIVYPLISVDVEALPHRASTSHTDVLVFGNVNDGVYGVERLCKLFKSQGVVGTFFIEVAGELLYGCEYLYKIRDILRQYDQDIGLHVHPEIFKKVPSVGLKGGFNGFADISYEDALLILSYCKEVYIKIFGCAPILFRPGAMQISAEMYIACRDVGLNYVSGYFRGHWKDVKNKSVENGFFQWGNDVFEIPLDLALDPLKGYWLGFEEYLKKKKSSAVDFKFLSLLIHSWSLIERDESGFHENYSPHYEEILKQYLVRLRSEFGFITHNEAIGLIEKSIVPMGAPVPLQVINRDSVSVSFEEDVDLAWREIESDSLSEVEPFITAMSLPLKVNDLSDVHFFSNGNVVCPVYLSAGKARILSTRVLLPDFPGLLYAVLSVAPTAVVSASKLVMKCSLRKSSVALKKVSESFYLQLPSSFEEYKDKMISKKLKYEIEREFRKHDAEGLSLTLSCISGEDLTFDIFSAAFLFINERLSSKDASIFSADWLSENYNLFRSRGVIVDLNVCGERKSVGVFLIDHEMSHYYAAAVLDGDLNVRNVSYGKILLYYSIEKMIAMGMSSINLGGGDYGYKSRFGAVSEPLYDFEYKFNQDAISPENAAFLLFENKSINTIESAFGGRVEDIFGYDFFDKYLGLDFDKPVSLAELGLDSTARPYVHAIDSAVYGLLDLVPEQYRNKGFADVGSGKGKVIYYAQSYKFSKYLGIELSDMLCNVSRNNFERIGLSNVVILKKNAALLSSDELRGIGVFFLYNPFDRFVVEYFAKALVAAAKENNEPICVCYLNSLCGDVFEENGFLILS